jgi:hypothetical protein
MRKQLRERALRLRYLIVWKVRELRGRATFVTIAAKESAATFTRIATMRPIMGGAPEPGDGGGSGGGDGGGSGGDGGGAPSGGGDGGDGGGKPKTDPPAENKLGEAERRRRKAERDAAEAQRKVEELEGKDASELEKAQQAAKKAEQKAAEAEEKAKRLERGAWVREAASKAGAIDDDVVVALVNLDDAEDAQTAEQLVKELAAQKPKLFGQREDGGGSGGGGAPGFGTPAGGSPPGGGTPGGGLPGIGADGTVDKAEVRKGLGGALLGAIRGRQAEGSLGGAPDDDDD